MRWCGPVSFGESKKKLWAPTLELFFPIITKVIFNSLSEITKMTLHFLLPPLHFLDFFVHLLLFANKLANKLCAMCKLSVGAAQLCVCLTQLIFKPGFLPLVTLLYLQERIFPTITKVIFNGLSEITKITLLQCAPPVRETSALRAGLAGLGAAITATPHVKG